MRHVAISALCVLVLACSKEEPQQAGVQVLINYTASFKTGCFIVKSMDTVTPTDELGKDEISITGVQKDQPQLKVAVLRKPGWPEQVRFVVTAHEQNCENTAVVTEASVDLDLSGAGFQEGRTQTLTLVTPDADGDGYVAQESGGTDCNDDSITDNPGRTDEACDGLDNNCDGQLDEGLTPRAEYFNDGDGDGVGAGTPVLACAKPPGRVAVGGDCEDTNAARTPNKAEVCNDIDDDCDGTTDEGFDKDWYGDSDGDGFGAQSKLRLSCEAQLAGHVRANVAGFDCDDDKPDVKPGAVEKCNDRDDNCANGADETFLAGTQRKGGSCLNDVCNGEYICDPTNDTRTACNAQPPTLYYPDVDEDTQGAVGATGQKVCLGDALPTGKVANDTDCDDVDPGTRLAAAEVCDGLDNNCNGQLDEGLTCGGVFLQVFDGMLGGGGHDWRTVAVDPTDGYPVWIAGLAGKLVVRNAVNAAFVSHSFGDSPANTTNCGDFDWYASWVRPSDGHVFLAGEDGRVAQHTGTACINQSDAPGTDNATGIWGFVSGGVTTLYIVTDAGKLSTWVPGSAPVQRHDNESGANSYKGIHALDPALLLVAGRDDSNKQFITSYLGGTLTEDSPHALSATVDDNVNALWMGATNLACAVGDGGRVWRWNGATNWTLVPPPSGVTSNFSSVVMPSGTNVAYIVDKGAAGKLRRLTQYGWARSPPLLASGQPNPIDPDVPLYDIAMTSVGDFWMVGDNGRVYHYPQP